MFEILSCRKYSPRIYQNPMKNKWSPLSTRCWSLSKGALLFQTYYDERSDFSTGVQDMLSYQHGLCMKKGCVNIKCSNELKTSDEEQNREFNYCETTNTWRLRLYIEEALKKQDTNHLHISFCKFL